MYAARLGDGDRALELLERGYADFVIDPFALTTEYAPAVFPEQPIAGPFTANLGGFLTSRAGRRLEQDAADRLDFLGVLGWIALEHRVVVTGDDALRLEVERWEPDARAAVARALAEVACPPSGADIYQTRCRKRSTHRRCPATPDSASRFTGRPGPTGPGRTLSSGDPAVEVLQQLVRGELDLLVPPLRCTVVAGDQPHPMETTEVAEDECVARFGLLSRALGEAEMPARVLLPGVRLQEHVLLTGAWLHVLPPRTEHVLAGVDQPLRLPDRIPVHHIGGHARILAKPRPGRIWRTRLRPESPITSPPPPSM